MKKIKFLMFVLIFLVLCSLTSYACEIKSGFSLKEMDNKDKETFLNNVHFSYIKDEPSKETIQCFDVNESGLIAIGVGNASSSNKSIYIYDFDGSFKCGVAFNCSGSFGLEWNECDLNIYFVRSDVAVSCDLNANVKSLAIIENTKENNSYWNHTIYSTSRAYGNGEMLIKNDMGILNVFATSYSQLVFINDKGEEVIVYDTSKQQETSTIVIAVIVIIFICIITFLAIGSIIKFKRKSKEMRLKQEQTEDSSVSG